MRLMEEIATVFKTRGYTINNSICETMKKFKLKTLCNQAGITKECGYSAIEVLTLLLMFPFMLLKNVHQLYRDEFNKKIEMKKDVLYRMKNNERYNWRKLLYGVAKTFKGLVNTDASEDSGTPGSKKAFVLDDTTDERTGWKMENISYVYDHVKKKTVLGSSCWCWPYSTARVPSRWTSRSIKKKSWNAINGKRSTRKTPTPKAQAASGGKKPSPASWTKRSP